MRKKIGLENQEADQDHKRSMKAAGMDRIEEREAQRKTMSAELSKERDELIGRERNWLANELKPLTRV